MSYNGLGVAADGEVRRPLGVDMKPAAPGKRRGRPPIGEQSMTDAQRQRRSRLTARIRATEVEADHG